MTCKEIAARIDAHLKRFEADPEINKLYGSGIGKIHSYWNAGSRASGRWVLVSYIRFQHTSSLTKSDAEKYLAWLDEGNVGRHFFKLNRP